MTINETALVNLVRAAMGSGVMRFIDRLHNDDIDLTASLDEAFGDFPAEFLRIRTDLVEQLVARHP